MKLSIVGLLVGLAASVLAEDLLFIDTLEAQEYIDATTTLGFTVKVVTEVEWRAMTTVEFAAFKAIVIADNYGDSDLADIQFLDDTKAIWSPAVTGNMILIGTDPSNHYSYQPGAGVLIDNAIKFAAAGTSTGLYFALSQFYDTVDTATVTSLSEFGDFEVRGNLDCYNVAHIVASSPALATLDDAALSDWSCSVHEAFSDYPKTGLGGFQALAIAKDIIGAGSQTFGDNTMGLPYIISRGATPAGCGDGKWNPDLGEECDDGNTLNGDGCSASCKCESGMPSGSGTCLSKISSSSSYSVSTTPVYRNSSSTTVATVTPTTPAIIIGVEIIVEIIVIEDCQTHGAQTITSYITSTCSTLERPIFNTVNPAYPCYPCQMASQGISCPSNSFITAVTTICPSCPASISPTPLPVVQLCPTCSPITLSSAPSVRTTLAPGAGYVVTVESITASHDHGASATPAAVTTSYGTAAVKPSTSPMPFVGAAAGKEVVIASVIGGAVVVALALL